MTRLLPFPILSVCLLVMWLLLNQTLSAGHIVLGCILALVGPLTLAALQLPSGGLRRPGAIARLAVLVIMDIIRSNIVVARKILNARSPSEDVGLPDHSSRLARSLWAGRACLHHHIHAWHHLGQLQ